jgi:hypothetical protein
MLFLRCSCVVVVVGGVCLWTSLGVKFVLGSLFAASCSYLIPAILLSINICYVFGVLLKKDSCPIRNIYIVNRHKVLVPVKKYWPVLIVAFVH